MINWRFFWAQFKSVSFFVIIFALLFVPLIALGLIFKSFAPSVEKVIFESSTSTSYSAGAGFILQQILFGGAGLSLFFGLGVTIIGKIVLRENERGYVGSWLTTPMSRWTIFNTKMFVVLFSFFLVFGWNFILQCIYTEQLLKILRPISALYCWLMWTCLAGLLIAAIIWIIGSLVSKPGVALGISSGIYAWFIIAFFILVPLGGGGIPSLGWMKYFKYLTIFSLFNYPLQFEDPSTIHFEKAEQGIKYAAFIALKALDYA